MTIASRQQFYTVQEVARLLGVGPIKLFATLRELGVLDDGNAPYPRYVQAGYFKVELKHWRHPETGEHPYARTKITLRGIEWIENKLTARNEYAKRQDQTIAP